MKLEAIEHHGLSGGQWCYHNNGIDFGDIYNSVITRQHINKQRKGIGATIVKDVTTTILFLIDFDKVRERNPV